MRGWEEETRTSWHLDAINIDLGGLGAMVFLDLVSLASRGFFVLSINLPEARAWVRACFHEAQDTRRGQL